ncbi:hypothetical protein H0H92_013233 [Tricholoma furcatifolium]|nr:hypothetical protein H0H92_013233 [Tricholoma furcatifolium]
MGRDEFSCLVFRELYAARDVWDELVIATNPDEKTGRRGSQLSISPLKLLGESLKLPVHNIPHTKPEFKKWNIPEPFSVSDEPPNNHVIVTASFGRILTSSMLDKFSPGRRLNIHPSLLPAYRGSAPIQHAILNDEKETGVSVIEMLKWKDGIDAGAIWGTRRVPLHDGAMFMEMRNTLGSIGGRLLVSVLRDMRVGKRPLLTCLATEKTVQLHSPYVLDSPPDSLSDVPGSATFQKATRTLVIRCADGSVLSVPLMKQQDKALMEAKDWWNGAKGLGLVKDGEIKFVDEFGHLLRATKSHPFLISASNNNLSDSLLSLWLSQDRIYAAQAYPRFVGSLISHIPFRPPILNASTSPDHSQRILKILVFALENIVREVGFFDEISEQWNFDLGRWSERKGTRDYTAEMARISGTGKVEEGLLFLWAMEKVYFDVWTAVNNSLTSIPGSSSALRSLAKNWSTVEFKAFVDDLAALVDDIYRDLGRDSWTLAEDIWRRVLELEEGFWPNENDETDLII